MTNTQPTTFAEPLAEYADLRARSVRLQQELATVNAAVRDRERVIARALRRATLTGLPVVLHDGQAYQERDGRVVRAAFVRAHELAFEPEPDPEIGEDWGPHDVLCLPREVDEAETLIVSRQVESCRCDDARERDERSVGPAREA